MTTVGLVTGAASGVGAATAVALAERGVTVAVCDVSPAGAEVASQCGGLFVSLDVADPSSWLEAMATITKTLGPVDVAHLNAGVMTAPADGPIDAAMRLSDVSALRAERVIGVNLGGVIHGLRNLWIPMTERGSGAIVATASAAGLSPYPFDPVYSATKHAIVGLVRSVAGVLGSQGVRVQAICPGGIDTPLLPDVGRAAGIPLLSPQQVAAGVVELLLDGREGTVFSIDHDHPEMEISM
jgi:NAD(P)-dependent dehydrogenase (short-subunit alcohol dehydrogenase family)